jgi:hypothetical protein
MAPPPVAPQSPMTQRKLSVNAPFKPSPGHSPNPPAAGFPPKRPVETIEPQKINRFGEAKLRSPKNMNNGGNDSKESIFDKTLKKQMFNDLSTETF